MTRPEDSADKRAFEEAFSLGGFGIAAKSGAKYVS
jgi:hypothetical protein